MDQASPQLIKLEDYQPFPFGIDRVDLTFELGEEHTVVTSQLEVTRLQQDVPLRLHGEDLELVSISLNGSSLSDDMIGAWEDGIEIGGIGDVSPSQPSVVTSLR